MVPVRYLLVAVFIFVLTSPGNGSAFCRFGEASMVINAPAEIVYETIVDVASYPHWNPFILRVEPEDADITVTGAKFTLITDLNVGSFGESDEETVIAVPPTPDEPGLLIYAYRGTGYEYLESERVQTFTVIDETTTLYESVEQFCGLLSLFVPFRSVQDGFERQTAALAEEAVRRYSESTATESNTDF